MMSNNESEDDEYSTERAERRVKVFHDFAKGTLDAIRNVAVVSVILYAARASESTLLYFVAGVGIIAITMMLTPFAYRILPAPKDAIRRWRYLIFSSLVFLALNIGVFVLLANIIERLVRIQLSR